jgi:hypothetical protein
VTIDQIELSPYPNSSRSPWAYFRYRWMVLHVPRRIHHTVDDTGWPGEVHHGQHCRATSYSSASAAPCDASEVAGSCRSIAPFCPGERPATASRCICVVAPNVPRDATAQGKAARAAPRSAFASARESDRRYDAALNMGGMSVSLSRWEMSAAPARRSSGRPNRPCSHSPTCAPRRPGGRVSARRGRRRGSPAPACAPRRR